MKYLAAVLLVFVAAVAQARTVDWGDIAPTTIPACNCAAGDSCSCGADCACKSNHFASDIEWFATPKIEPTYKVYIPPAPAWTNCKNGWAYRNSDGVWYHPSCGYMPADWWNDDGSAGPSQCQQCHKMAQQYHQPQFMPAGMTMGMPMMGGFGGGCSRGG
jgi:hypothetical protein